MFTTFQISDLDTKQKGGGLFSNHKLFDLSKLKKFNDVATAQTLDMLIQRSAHV